MGRGLEGSQGGQTCIERLYIFYTYRTVTNETRQLRYLANRKGEAGIHDTGRHGPGSDTHILHGTVTGSNSSGLHKHPAIDLPVRHGCVCVWEHGEDE